MTEQVIKQNTREEIIEHFEPKTGSTHLYRVTHYLADNGRDTGDGKIEQRETIHGADGERSYNWRRTGGSYSGFLAHLYEAEAADRAQKEYAAAMQALAEKQAAYNSEAEDAPPALPVAAATGIAPVPVFPSQPTDEE